MQYLTPRSLRGQTDPRQGSTSILAAAILCSVIVVTGVGCSNLLWSRFPIFIEAHTFQPWNPVNDVSEFGMARRSKSVVVIDDAPHQQTIRWAASLYRFNIFIWYPIGKQASYVFRWRPRG